MVHLQEHSYCKQRDWKYLGGKSELINAAPKLEVNLYILKLCNITTDMLG